MLGDQDHDQVEALVRAFRLRMGVPDDAVLDMPDLLRRMRIAGELKEVRESGAVQLGDSAAMFDPELDAIIVSKESVRRQSPRDRFTFAHELGHKLAGHQQLRHRKTGSKKQFGKQVQIDEEVANAIAAAILIPEYLAKVDQSTTAEDLAMRFAVSLPMAKLRLNDLQRRHRLRRGIVRATPAEFDSGSYDDSMAEMAANSRRWNG